MIQAYSKKEIRNTFYQLKRDWGITVEYHKIVLNQVDLTSGVTRMEYDIFQVRRAILLPSETVRNLTFLAKPFEYGGEHDSSERWLFIDRKDLPLDFVINADDFMFIGDVKYSYKKPVEDYGFDTVMVFRLVVTLPEKDEVA